MLDGAHHDNVIFIFSENLQLNLHAKQETFQNSHIHKRFQEFPTKPFPNSF